MHLWGLIILTCLSVPVLLVRMVMRYRRHLPSISRGWAITGLFVLFGGVLLVIWMADDIMQARTIAHWPHVSGNIVNASIEDGGTYRPKLTYRYKVGNQVYSGVSNLHTPGFGGKRKRYDAASGLIKKFHPGDSVAVFYDPAQPSASTLLPSSTWDVYVKLSTGALLFILGLFVAILPRSSKNAT